eukprot:TRINITY_DN14347_c0_g1_i12.p2 TRINITY_DN14347_c0_g1~~TRINITY_DN14347_c0_g1_i12.p2  ORF type:complete len:127 (-),score=36.46 TRINITY_DN14347_c0_g1_i12:159-539(-)
MGGLRSEAEQKDQAIQLWFINRLFATLSISLILAGAISSFDIYVRSGMQNEEGYGKYTCIAEVFWVSLYTFILVLLMLLYMPRESLSQLTQNEEFVVVEANDDAKYFFFLVILGCRCRNAKSPALK